MTGFVVPEAMEENLGAGFSPSAQISKETGMGSQRPLAMPIGNNQKRKASDAEVVEEGEDLVAPGGMGGCDVVNGHQKPLHDPASTVRLEDKTDRKKSAPPRPAPIPRV